MYGAWLASGNILNWILVVDPGISTVVMQRIGQSYGANERALVGEYALGGMLVTALVVLLVLIGGYVCSLYVSGWINITDLALVAQLQQSFLIAVIASSLTLMAFAVGAVNLGLQASFAHGLNFLVANTFSLITTAVLLLLDWGLLAISIGLLVRAVVFLGGGLGYMLWRCQRESMPLIYNGARIKEILSLMSFTSLGRIGGILSRNMDAFFIARFLGPGMVPVFVLSRRGLNVAEMLLNRTGNAIGPSLSHLAGEGDIVKMRGIVSRLLSLNLWLLGLAFGGFLAFNGDFIRLWVGAEFFAGRSVSALLCVLLVFTVLFTLLQTLCVALGDIKRSSVMQFIQAIITFSLLVAGICYWGLIGAVIAPIVGFIVIASWYYPRSLGHLAFLERSNWLVMGREALLSGLLGVGLSGLCMHLELTSWLSFLLAGASMATAYFVLLFALSSPFRSEASQLIGLITQKIRKVRSAS
ncbi:lipopolysaccharide biosynthesis protein [Coraliomargarita sp. W4R72]